MLNQFGDFGSIEATCLNYLSNKKIIFQLKNEAISGGNKRTEVNYSYNNEGLLIIKNEKAKLIGISNKYYNNFSNTETIRFGYEYW